MNLEMIQELCVEKRSESVKILINPNSVFTYHVYAAGSEEFCSNYCLDIWFVAYTMGAFIMLLIFHSHFQSCGVKVSKISNITGLLSAKKKEIDSSYESVCFFEQMIGHAIHICYSDKTGNLFLLQGIVTNIETWMK